LPPGGAADGRAAPGRADGLEVRTAEPEGAVFGGGAAGGSEGRSSRMPLPVIVPGRWRLYSRQHEGHRHSTSRSPEGVFERVSRQPNCALMSV
jgi:hypothetical protein